MLKYTGVCVYTHSSNPYIYVSGLTQVPVYL